MNRYVRGCSDGWFPAALSHVARLWAFVHAIRVRGSKIIFPKKVFGRSDFTRSFAWISTQCRDRTDDHTIKSRALYRTELTWT